MHLLSLILVLAVGACDAGYWQKLTCPYDLKHDDLQRVWCRQSSADCCTGLVFSRSAQSVDGGKLKVAQDSGSFTVSVLEPSQEAGVYWCGVLSKNGTIIRLAETYIHSSPGAYIWSFARWILLFMLPMVTIFTSVYTRTTTKCFCKRAEEPHDIAESRTLAAPEYENTAFL